MPNLVDSDGALRDYFVDYRKKKTVNVIPYDASLPQKPVHETPLGNHSNKKVTVVGMGQVGLGCVAAILNQDRLLVPSNLSSIYVYSLYIHIIYNYIYDYIYMNALTQAAVFHRPDAVIMTAGCYAKPKWRAIGAARNSSSSSC